MWISNEDSSEMIPLLQWKTDCPTPLQYNAKPYIYIKCSDEKEYLIDLKLKKVAWNSIAFIDFKFNEC